MTTAYKFKATFTKAGVATTPSSAATIKVVDSADNILVAAATATTALTNLAGCYIYSYSGADGLDLIGRFTTTDTTMDQLDLDSYTPIEIHDIDTVVDSILEDTNTLPGTLATLDTDIWSYSSRTLTQAAASVISAVSGSDLTIYAGDTFTAALTNIGVLTGYSKIYFSVKHQQSDTDAESIIQIEKTSGLLYINGAVALTAANGSLTINDEPTGDITIVLKPVETIKAVIGSYFYDVKVINTDGTAQTKTQGYLSVVSDITKAIA